MKRAVALGCISAAAILAALAIAIDPTVIEPYTPPSPPRRTRRRDYVVNFNTPVVTWAGKRMGGDA